MLTYEEIRAFITTGKPVHWRNCRLCKTPMAIRLSRGHPTLTSCVCRPTGKTSVIDLSWEELRLLVNRHENHAAV